jgi:hypothetical protein
MDSFTKLFGGWLALAYHCFDRIEVSGIQMRAMKETTGCSRVVLQFQPTIRRSEKSPPASAVWSFISTYD